MRMSPVLLTYCATTLGYCFGLSYAAGTILFPIGIIALSLFTAMLTIIVMKERTGKVGES